MNAGRLSTKFLVGIVRQRFLLFIIPFLTAAITGGLVVWSLPSVYSANATILIESQQIPEDLVKSTITAQASERLHIIQQQVLTREYLLSLVDKFELFKGRVGLSRSDIVDLMRERIAFKPIDLETSDAKKRNDRVAVAFVIEFSFENAETAMKVANELVSFILEKDISSRTEQASDTTKFLERETQHLSNELALVQDELSRFRLENSETLPEKLAFNMNLLERTEGRIADLNREIIGNDEQSRIIKLESSIKGYSEGTSPLDPFAALRKKLTEAKIEYEVKKATYAEAHPEMRVLKRSIVALEQELGSGATPQNASAAGAGNPEISIDQEKLTSLAQARTVMLEQKAKLEEDEKRLRAIVLKSPETGAAVAVLEKKEAALQKSLDDMSTRFSQARLGQRLEQDQRAEKFQVIEQPVLPQAPSKPNRPALLGAVLAAALGLGAVTSTTAELLDSTVRRSADIERQLNQRPLVVIPYIWTKEERLRQRKLLMISAICAFAVVIAVLLLVHFFVMPVDEILFKIIGRLGG